MQPTPIENTTVTLETWMLLELLTLCGPEQHELRDRIIKQSFINVKSPLGKPDELVFDENPVSLEELRTELEPENDDLFSKCNSLIKLWDIRKDDLCSKMGLIKLYLANRNESEQLALLTGGYSVYANCSEQLKKLLDSVSVKKN